MRLRHNSSNDKFVVSSYESRGAHAAVCLVAILIGSEAGLVPIRRPPVGGRHDEITDPTVRHMTRARFA